MYQNKKAAEIGTELHEFAHKCIELNRKQPKTKDSVNMFVNDVLHYKMDSERTLYYSDYCFGTADAIGYEEKRDGSLLRIFDLKTGETPASMHQLEIYAALFFLEYGNRLGPACCPEETGVELRIYQGGEIQYESPSPDDILSIMEIIVHFDEELRLFDSMK